MTTINSRIRNRRKDLGIRLEQIASEFGITYQAVQQWEREGGTTPRRPRMKQLARILKTTVEWLETGNGPEQNQDVQVLQDSGPSIYRSGWPFLLVSLDRVQALTAHERGFVEGKLLAAIEECEASRHTDRLGNGHST